MSFQIEKETLNIIIQMDLIFLLLLRLRQRFWIVAFMAKQTDIFIIQLVISKENIYVRKRKPLIANRRIDESKTLRKVFLVIDFKAICNIMVIT